MIYFDNNATTKPLNRVKCAVKPLLEVDFGNPSSNHSIGRSAKMLIDKARIQIAQSLGAENYNIYFTSGATESNNSIFASILRNNPIKKSIVISAVEHASITSLMPKYIKAGYNVIKIPVDQYGNMDISILDTLDAKDIAVISVMLANSETGHIFPVNKIHEFCKKHNIHFHCDAVQGIGKLEFSLEKLSLDSLAISGHKVGALKGVGCLLLKKGAEYTPYIVGGHQENNMRAGTENVIGIVSIGEAMQHIKENLFNDIKILKSLRDYFEKSISEIQCSHINGGNNPNRICNTSNVHFKGINSNILLTYLDSHNICVSTGSACDSSTIEPSPVLFAMTGDYSVASESLRFSFSTGNTKEEIDYTAMIIKKALSELI